MSERGKLTGGEWLYHVAQFCVALTGIGVSVTVWATLPEMRTDPIIGPAIGAFFVVGLNFFSNLLRNTGDSTPAKQSSDGGKHI